MISLAYRQCILACAISYINARMALHLSMESDAERLGLKLRPAILDAVKSYRATACNAMHDTVGALKTREWKTRHQTAGVENVGVEKYGKPKVPVI